MARLIIKIPQRTAFVINPVAGSGKAGRIWLKIESALKKSGQQYRAYFTEKAGGGTGLAAHAVSEGAELIVAVGGDGTLREVVNGLDLSRTILGVIPAGTGNGFVRSCGIPLHWSRALKGLSTWKPQPVDLGLISDDYFLNVVGFGFDAAVAAAANTKYDRFNGYFPYLLAFIDQLAELKRFYCKARCDNLYFEDRHTVVALVANGSFYGGKLCIAPRASIDDGHLDLLLFRRRSIPELFNLGFRVIFRQHYKSGAVLEQRGRKIYLEVPQDIPAHIDGDIVNISSAEIKIRPSALRILAPERLARTPLPKVEPAGCTFHTGL